MASDEPIEAFEKKRQKLKGLKAVIAEIENNLRALKEYRDEQSNNTGSK
jgi:hypothetical protein